jgi:hypothetical protein
MNSIKKKNTKKQKLKEFWPLVFVYYLYFNTAFKTTTIKFERILAGSYCVLFVFGSGLALL